MDEWPNEPEAAARSTARVVRLADPLTAVPAQHPAAGELQLARGSIDREDWTAAARHLDRAKQLGVPAETAPHLAVGRAIALACSGRNTDAERIARAAWSEYPDVAALPAIMGIAADPSSETALCLVAALASGDPDHSLLIWAEPLAAAATARLRSEQKSSAHRATSGQPTQ